MNKYKEGDKFIAEIEDIFSGSSEYRLKNGAGVVLECSLDKMQQYHEPTQLEHAKALKEYCEETGKTVKCEKCELVQKDGKCFVFDSDWYGGPPSKWELEQNKLTEEEREILEFWKKQGATKMTRGNYIYCIFYSNKGYLGNIETEGIFKNLEIGKTYNIDNLLKGDF